MVTGRTLFVWPECNFMPWPEAPGRILVILGSFDPPDLEHGQGGERRQPSLHQINDRAGSQTTEQCAYTRRTRHPWWEGGHQSLLHSGGCLAGRDEHVPGGAWVGAFYQQVLVEQTARGVRVSAQATGLCEQNMAAIQW
jgi:hypothetical protein